ncbi:MAG: ABC transporter substrate-binding protein [Dehalococcoidia bacterium]
MSDRSEEQLEEAAAAADPEAPAGSAATPIDASARLDRRTLLRGIGLGLAGISLSPLLAACGSSSTKIAKAPIGAAPANGTPIVQIETGTSLKILLWNHFVPAFDTFFDKFAKDWGTANHVDMQIDHVDIAQLPGRLAAEVAARKGHDLFGFQAQIQTQRYQKYLVNVDEIMNALIKQYGNVIPIAKAVAQVNNTWYGVPSYNVLIAPIYRTDLLKQQGLNAPLSWQDVLDSSKKLKPAGHPAGIAISHCNDSNHNWRAVMYGYGASTVHADGKTLALDTPEMKDFLNWAKEFQATGNADEVYAWGDVSDNQYLGAGTGWMIHDAISSLRSLQGKNDELYNNLRIGPVLKGPKAQINQPDPQVLAMWNFTPKKNLEAASAFLYYYMTQFKTTFVASTGYNMPVFENLLKKPMPVLGEDPKYNILQDYAGGLLQDYAYPGPVNQAAEEVLSSFIVPDMIARLKGSGTVDDAIKWATDQMKPIYAKNFTSLTPAPNVTPVR